MKITLLLIIITGTLFVNTDIFSQVIKPTNIIYQTIGDKIEIFYDLPRNSDTLDVKIFFRKKSDPKTKYHLNWVSGSVGIGVFSGKKKKVVWNYKKEPPSLFTGSGFYYEVVVTRFHSVFRK